MADIPLIGKKEENSNSTLNIVQCPKCQYKYFETLHLIQIISELMSKSGKKEMIMVPVFRCGKCGFILNETKE